MVTINSHSFNGTVVKSSLDQRIFTVHQDVTNEFACEMQVFVPSTVTTEIPPPGQEVIIFNSLAYLKDGLMRFRIDAPDKLQLGKTRINIHSISGMVKDFSSEGKNGLITIEQIVRGTFPTEFKVFVPGPLIEKSPLLMPDIGDFILIDNALAYEKEGSLRFKVNSIDQMQFTEPKDLDRGTVSADVVRA